MRFCRTLKNSVVSLLTGRGRKLNRWRGWRLWTPGYNHMQPNLRARIVWVIRRDTLSLSHTAGCKSERLGACFMRRYTRGQFTVHDVYCGPLTSRSIRGLFVLPPCRQWLRRRGVAVMTGGIQAETWRCDLQTGQSGLQDISLCRSDGETHVRLKSKAFHSLEKMNSFSVLGCCFVFQWIFKTCVSCFWKSEWWNEQLPMM